jgi:hypothetical protein
MHGLAADRLTGILPRDPRVRLGETRVDTGVNAVTEPTGHGVT